MPANRWRLRSRIGANNSWQDLTPDLSEAVLRAGFLNAVDIFPRLVSATLTVRLTNQHGRYSRDVPRGPFTELYDDAAASPLVWRGRLEYMRANERERTASLRAFGPWEAARRLPSGTPIIRNSRGGNTLHGVFDRAGWPRAYRAFDDGDVSLPYFWTPEDVVERIAEGPEVWEIGRILESRDYKIAFESRLHRADVMHSMAKVRVGDTAGTIRAVDVRASTDSAQIINEVSLPVQSISTAESREIYRHEEPLRITAASNDDVLLLPGGDKLLLPNGADAILLPSDVFIVRIEIALTSNQAVEWSDAVVTVTANAAEDGTGDDIPISSGAVSLVPRSSNTADLYVSSPGMTAYIQSIVINGRVTSRSVVESVFRENIESIEEHQQRFPSPRVSTWATTNARANGYALEQLDSWAEGGRANFVEFDLADGFEQEWQRWISDRYGVNTMLRNNSRLIDEYFIERLTLHIRPRGPARLRWDGSSVGRGPAATVDGDELFRYDYGRYNVDRVAG